MIDIETTPDGATLVSVSEPLDYGLVADLFKALPELRTGIKAAK